MSGIRIEGLEELQQKLADLQEVPKNRNQTCADSAEETARLLLESELGTRVLKGGGRVWVEGNEIRVDTGNAGEHLREQVREYVEEVGSEPMRIRFEQGVDQAIRGRTPE